MGRSHRKSCNWSQQAKVVTLVTNVGTAKVIGQGVQVAVVIGGGNIFRGVALGAEGMDRATADSDACA